MKHTSDTSAIGVSLPGPVGDGTPLEISDLIYVARIRAILSQLVGLT